MQQSAQFGIQHYTKLKEQCVKENLTTSCRSRVLRALFSVGLMFSFIFILRDSIRNGTIIMHFSSLVRLQLLSDMEIWFRKLIVVEYFVSFFVCLVSLQSKVLIQNKDFYFISRHSMLCLYDVCHV